MHNSSTLEDQLGEVVALLKDFDPRGALDRLNGLDHVDLVDGTTYVAVDANGNAIARVGLDAAEADRQVGNLLTMGYTWVKTVRGSLQAPDVGDYVTVELVDGGHLVGEVSDQFEDGTGFELAAGLDRLLVELAEGASLQVQS